MNETWTTLQGWVGSEVTLRDARGVDVASFRIGCTPRFLRGGEWVNGETNWYTVNCWRGLARNVAESVHKSDPVVVHGRMRVDVWKREGQPDSVSYVVDASFVGHDLNRGVTAFERVTARGDRGEVSEDESVRTLVHGYDAQGPQLDSEGQPLSAA